MKLKELVNKIDNDIVLWIVRDEDNKTVFRKERTYDVIPKDLMDMEVGRVFSLFNRLFIYVKRNCSFRELLDRIHGYEYIDVYVVNCDGTKEKVYSNRAVFVTNYKYDNYWVKKVSLHEVEWGDKIEIEIEPCEEMKEKEKEMKKNTIFKMGDVVWSQHFGCGHVTSTDIGTGTPYVIEVTWEGAVPRYDYFTKDGQYDLDDPDPDCDIHPITDVKPLEYDKEK